MTAPMEFEEAEGRELSVPLSGFSTHPPLVCFPMRADWEAAQAPRDTLTAHEAWLLAQDDYTPRAAHPEPEYTGRWETRLRGQHVAGEGLRLPTPLPVLKLAEFSREHSWETEMRYARGTGIHAGHGRATSLRHVIALRFRDHPVTARTAIAVYESPVSKIAWTWASVWVMGPDLPPCGALSLAELKEFLAEPDRPAGWFESIKKAAWERSQEAKARAKSRPKKARDQTAM